ncbi:MAG TPA: diacylglycerol kinase family protein [Paludibacter sp.]|nr:diacylglycerol kinase family protein [Paludibacter sp.]
MKKRLQSFRFAGRGIRLVFTSEPNMKIHLAAVLLVTCCGFIFSISKAEWLACLVCFGMVMGAEMVNTAIELTVDLVSPEFDPLAGKAKDVAAGAVLVCSIISAIVGLLIFVPKGLHLLHLLS